MKFLFLYRNPKQTTEYQPSPEEIQGILQAWHAWKDKFKENIVEMGDGLKSGGKVLHANDELTDGPFIEAKEVLGGYSIVEADSYETAVEVAKACPIREMPGNSIEIREMAEY